MFGRRFWGKRWFGSRYWGDGGSLAPPEEAACQFFFTNFEEDSLAASPSGWTERGTTGYHSLAIENRTPPFKRRVVALSSEDGAQAAFSVDAVDAFTNPEEADIAIAVQRDASNDHERFQVYVRGQGSSTITDGYIFAIDFTNQRIRIYKLVASVQTNPFADLSISHAAGDFMVYRFRVGGSATTTLKAKTWAPDEDEPSAWGLTVTDSSSPVTAAGWVGFGGYIPSGLGSSLLNFFSVSTGGCSAHVPAMNDAFLAWLDTPAKRCVLAEFSATGYDGDASPAATRTVNAYVSNMGFRSRETDTPSNQFYPPWIKKVPTFKREMSVALSGKATTGFGSMVIDNSNTSGRRSAAGDRDDWLRMKWKRDYVTLYLGDPSWHKADFRKVIVGQLGQPTAPKESEIEFALSDILGVLDRPLPTNRISGGPLDGRRLPVVAGIVDLMEPVLIDEVNRTFQLHDGPIISINHVYDDGVALESTGNTIASVDDTTDTLTTTDPHGLGEDSRVIFPPFPSPAPPPGLSRETTYYVLAAGLTASDFRLSLARGGSTEDITGTIASPKPYTAYTWWQDLSTAQFTTTAATVGRVAAGPVAQADYNADLARIDDVLATLIFDRYGLSLDYKNQDTFDELHTDIPEMMGMVFYDQDNATALSATEKLCKSVNAWYSISPDGLLQVGRLKLPAATAAMEFSASDIKAGSLLLTKRILPVNRETLAVRRALHYFFNGPMNLSPERDAVLNAPYQTNVSSGWGAPGTPLDDHSDLADVMDIAPLDSGFLQSADADSELSRLETFFAKTLGVYSFQTRLRALTLSIGDTIHLDHPRLGWKEWHDYDPSSPDNTGEIDSTKAVVIGIEIDLSGNDPFPVKLTVFRQIPGYYPEENLT